MNRNDISFYKLTVYGLVQGVGFRPYTAYLCEKLGLPGFVRNTGGSVEIVAGGEEKALKELMKKLYSLGKTDGELPGARVTSIEREEIEKEEFDALCRIKDGFYIEESDTRGRLSIIPADIGICARCSDELLNNNDRRYLHPFISCVSCGPRFSVMKKLPYDRENTAMDVFFLCDECKREYDRSPFRRYAQTIACNSCGPVLKAYIKKDGKIICAAEGLGALELANGYIKEGKICAVKNTGGYHFTFDAFNDSAALRLRKIKARENKPFAVMFSDVDVVRSFCIVNDTEKELLTSDIRPIVLLKNNKDGSLPGSLKIAENVCKNSTRTGAMLPCDAVQVLLSQEFPALVMTSANLNSEPIAKDDSRALNFLSEDIVDIVLSNDRKILHSLDDSIFQVVKTGSNELVQVIRRARGLVPKGIEIHRSFKGDVFASGGDLKAVFAYGIGNSVILSGHYGDLDNMAAFDLWKEDRKDYEKILRAKPQRVVCDMHPGYFSTAESEKSGLKLKKIQHHYAHIMSVAAEHNLKGSLLGLALDGTGYGTDGTIWGSELLVCDCETPGSFKRAGHFEEIELTGGENALKNADITAMCFVHEGIKRGYLPKNENPYKDNDNYQVIEKALENGINTYKSTSAGRLFDALSAALGICHVNSYEGECPVLLQQQAEACPESSEDVYCNMRSEQGVYIADTIRLFCDILKLGERGYTSGVLALTFHRALSDVLIRQIMSVRNDTGIRTVALSGGVFANALILRLMYDELSEKDFDVYINEQVPPTDGGIALGQIFGGERG